MSREIEQKVVEMRFDNRNFEKNATMSMGTLEKLKKCLNLDGASKGLERIDKSVKKVDMSPLSDSVGAVSLKFNALYTVADQTLRNITNSAIQTGKRVVSALTIDPIKTGFSEYETKMGSIQTIMSNTASKGTTMEDVTRVIDELNTYADKTIYNFAEMTRNIGTFTAAGVGLEESAAAIQGIANLAAASGSTSQQASTAMYQLSQALAAGTVKLMDWNSVVNAGMGGEKFQEALKATARDHGVAVDDIIKKNGSFRESLQDGWITADILNETLNKFTVDGAKNYAKSMMESGKWTREQADALMKEAQSMEDAATKVKTFTQLCDTLKESAQSGWGRTWELVVGNFEESKELFTNLSDMFGGIINAMSDSRNNLLEGALSSNWNKLAESMTKAGLSTSDLKDSLIEIAKSKGISIDKIIEEYGSFEKSLKSGWVTTEILSEALGNTTETLNSLSDAELESKGYTEDEIKALRKLSEQAKNTDGSLDKLVDGMTKTSGRELLVESLLNTLKGLGSVLKPIGQAFRDVFPATSSDQLYSLITKIRDFTSGLTLSGEQADKVRRTFKGLFSVLDFGRKIVVTVFDAFAKLLGSDGIGDLASSLLDITASFGDFLTALNDGFKTDGISGFLTTMISTVSDVISSSVGSISSFGDAIASVGKFIVGVANTIWKSVKPVFTWLAENVSVADIFAGLAGGGIFIVAKKVSGILDKIVDAVKNLFGGKGGLDIKDLVKHFGDALGALHDSLSSFALGLKVSSLVMIAASIAILSASLRSLSGIDIKDLGKSITAIGLLLGGLILTLKGVTTVINASGSKGLIKTAIALMLIASSIKILSNALVTMSALSFPKLVKGLIGVGGGMLILTKALGKIAGSNVTLRTSIALLALAKSCDILADALVKFGSMSWKEIGIGLSAMGGALFELVTSMAILQKFGGFKSLAGSLGILIVVQALEPLVDALIKFGSMTWKEIGKGLSAMGGALLEVGAMSGALGKIAGMSGLVGSGSIVLVTKGLDELANALIKFGSMTWKEIGKGLSAMGGALLEVALMSGALGMIAGMSGFCGAGAIVITIKALDDLANALIKFGSMTWKEIGKGLSAMGGALLEVALMSGALGMIAGLSGLIGAGTITTVVKCLDDLANALIKFGSMTWKEIGKGLSAMGGALLEVGAMSGALGMIAGFSGIIGGAAIWVTVQGLDDLANALIKFGSMSWAEIGRGLTAMGAAMLEVGAISGGLGYFTGLAGILGGASIWTTVQSLDDLANALVKFGSMSWDEVKNGLAAMGAALGEVAIGGLVNSLSFLGGLSLSTITGPLADLADSVKKWADVTVPEGLADQLGVLAEGVGKFTFQGLGAGALSEASASVGILADSVKKWKDVTVPKDIVDNMGTLADGVKKFWSAGIGASALSDSAGAVGILADSIKKWKDVSVPDNIGTDIGKIADGVKKFSFAFAGGWSMSAIVGPLGKMAGSIKKWDGVTVPSTIKKDLTNLANGINKFSFAFAGGWSLSAIVKPLGNLAGSIKKWDGVTVPEGLGAGLKSIANGIASFNTSVSVADIASGVDSLISSIKTLSETSYDTIIAGFTNLKTCVSTTMAGIVSIANEYTPQFSKIGENLARGFANGISLYSYVATNAAKTMAAKAAEAAKAELDEHSPSRVFEGIGKFTVLGFANGIRKNTKDATKSARTMSNDVLEATQDELGIHSPSVVFDKKVGRYIVQGIAKGITEETAAEKAAREKADAIVNAFKKEIDKVDLEGELQSSNFELWKLGEGRNASDATKYAEEEKFLTDEWRRAQKSQDWYYYQWEEMKAYYQKGQVNYEAVRQAENEFIKSQYETLTAKEAVDNLKKSKPFEVLEKTIDDNEKAIEIRNSLQENWLKGEGKYLSGEAQDARLLEDAQGNLRNYENLLTAEQQKHDLLIQQKSTALDKEQAEEAIYESYMKQRELESKIADEKERIAAIQNGALERELDKLDRQIEYRNNELELAKAKLGINATNDQLDALEKSHLLEELEDLNNQVAIEQKQWEELKKKYEEGTATIEEVNTAYDELVTAKTNVVRTQNEISQLDEDSAERRQRALEKQYGFASDNADTLYQIWEKTEGKKASGAEKDVKKISMLSEQLSAQSSLLVLAREEWEDAKRDYGRSSTEAQEAYNAYLKKQLDVANIQSEITDINEKAITRQKVAASEYKDYIKKYEKYYKLNGMSREELEKDAKLVSGYDGNKTVDKMISSTKNALDNISENKDYQSVSEGFKTLGTSYVTAVNEGLTEQSSMLVTTLLMMSLDCLETLNKDIDKWKDIGKRCVEGFVSGIQESIELAAQAAAQMAQAAMISAKAEFDINSPSRAFANIGMFAVMGLAKGLTDNSYLSNMAASELGKTAIDNLRETIRHISDVVDSDLDTQPVIRPVLDLSDVKSETARLNAMLSTSQAMGISASMSNRNRVDESQNGKGDNKSGNTYEFNQYNYSPKALSRADIYRQTKNQFAAMKGELT